MFIKRILLASRRAMITGIFFALSTVLFGAEVRDPNRSREEAERLEQKAAELKAAGRNDEARAVMRELDRLRQETKRRQADDERGGQGRSPEARQREIEKRLGALRAELAELEAAGKSGQAVEIKEQIERLEREQVQRPRGEGPDARSPWNAGGRDGRERRPAQGPDGRSPDMAEAQRRLHHLQAAIDNLHAAGMHEPAESLARQAEQLRQHIHSTPRPGSPMHGRMESRDELAPLHQEIRELREAVQDLRRRLDELAQDRR